jgi:lipoprotein NlpD
MTANVLPRPHRRAASATWLPALALAWVLGGCTSTSQHAPVEVRSPSGGAAATRPAPAPSVPAVDANAPKPEPGTYVVKPGDTLMRISLDVGQSWRDLARWNNIENPNLIEVGQALRIVAPAGDVAVAPKPVTPPKVETRPLDPKLAASAPGAASAASGPAGTPAPVVTPPARESDDDIQWAWPAPGPVITGFDDAKSKGLALSGKAGDPVYAAADGRVIYANSGLRGYGNLIIIKHNANYLTAYAHNQTLLVKEDQAVRRGQKIAEMGSTDADRVQLHFEVRRQGKPIDPSKVLPAR